MFKVASIICFMGILGTAPAADWSYSGDKGPNNWKDLDGSAKCGGTSQSPIDIKKDEVDINKDLGMFTRSTFNAKLSSMEMFNNGHTLQVNVGDDSYVIRDDSLLELGDYKLAQFHLHWANKADGTGSEHTVDGKGYFGEFHAVFYNTKYSGFAEAAGKDGDGLAVLGFFIKADYPQDNCAMDRILANLEAVEAHANKSITFEEGERASLETLLPPDISHYYRYSGSLTTPPCFESVTWTVFENPILISENQATRLATLLKDYKNEVLNQNFRPVLPLNNRKVYRNAGQFNIPSLFVTIIVAVAGALVSF